MSDETFHGDIATDTIRVALEYPRTMSPRTVTIALIDVRAADDLIVGYDYERDGWTLARADHPDTEVAFIRSWSDLEGDDGLIPLPTRTENP